MQRQNYRKLKIELRSHDEFLKAWDLFLSLGYKNDQKPKTSAYLYAHEDGTLKFCLFDSLQELSVAADKACPKSDVEFPLFKKRKYQEADLENMFHHEAGIYNQFNMHTALPTSDTVFTELKNHEELLVHIKHNALSKPHAADEYFKNHECQEVTLKELLSIAK